MKQSVPFGKMCGLSILELLVALVLFSIGLMGMAGLQANGLKHAEASDNRSQATMLAADLLDRVRANQPHIADYELGLGKAPGANGKRHRLAQADLVQWTQRVSQFLPAGRGEIKRNDRRITVRIVWNDRDPSGKSGFRQSQLSVSADIR